MIRFFVALIFLLSTSGCEAQLQKWQRERTVEHLARIKSYQGRYNWKVGNESSEMDTWFQSPNRFLIRSVSGEILRSDGSIMDIYDPKTKVHSIFKNLPSVTEADGKELIATLFDQNMQRFVFTLGPIDKIAGLGVIELRAKPKSDSIIESSVSQIYDEYSFPLKVVSKFKNGQVAQYEFSKISFNQNFDLPKVSIPDDALVFLWDLRKGTKSNLAKSAPQNLKLETTLTGPLGATLSYYRKGAQYLSIVRYKNFGAEITKGILQKVGKQDGYLFPGPIVNTLAINAGGTTVIYSSNLPVDDLINAALNL